MVLVLSFYSIAEFHLDSDCYICIIRAACTWHTRQLESYKRFVKERQSDSNLYKGIRLLNQHIKPIIKWLMNDFSLPLMLHYLKKQVRFMKSRSCIAVFTLKQFVPEMEEFKNSVWRHIYLLSIMRKHLTRKTDVCYSTLC